MRFHRMLTTVDFHTAGEPVRVVTSGIPHIPGKTMAEKRDFVQRNLDHLRTALLNEPRGHDSMWACIMTPPVSEGAAFGLIFMAGSGYHDMCGHGSIGAATMVVEAGMVVAREPETEVLIDVPAGLVRVRVKVEDGKARSATLQGVPSFLYWSGTIKIPRLGEVPVDIAYGGNFFAIIEARELGITTDAAGIRGVYTSGLYEETIQSINKQVPIQHPEREDIKGLEMMLVSHQPAKRGDNVKGTVRNIALLGDNFIDRSPCGSGTCASVATRYAKGELNLGETLVTESIIGSHFHARAIEEVRVGSFKAVIPELTGRAFVTGMHTFVMDEDDPFRYGFRV
jgi:proline racemase/trans-L-3-hydroxyproline dehydratase